MWASIVVLFNIYDAAHDGVLGNCFIAANAAFWSASALCFALDSVPQEMGFRTAEPRNPTRHFLLELKRA